MHSMLYVDTVDTKHIHTFLPITFLIFNRFSIRKKFWKAETVGFSNTIYVDIVDNGISISYAFLSITFLRSHPNSFLCGFSTIPSNTIYVNTVDTRQGSLMHSMLCMSTLLIQNTSTHFSL